MATGERGVGVVHVCNSYRSLQKRRRLPPPEGGIFSPLSQKVA